MPFENPFAGGESVRHVLSLVGLGLTAALLIACTSPGARGPAWKPAPPPGEHEALLYLFREDARRNPSTAHLELDGRKIGTLDDREYAPLRLAPGLHVLRVRLATGLILATSWNRIRFQARGGETVYLHVFVDFESTAVDPTFEADYGAPGRGSTNVAAKVFLVVTDELDGQIRVERCTLARDIQGIPSAYRDLSEPRSGD